MWESICLTLVATAGNNIGKVLQKKGTVILPPLSFKLKVGPSVFLVPGPFFVRGSWVDCCCWHRLCVVGFDRIAHFARAKLALDVRMVVVPISKCEISKWVVEVRCLLIIKDN